MLEERHKMFGTGKKAMRNLTNDQIDRIPSLTKKYEFLKDIPASALVNALARMRNYFNRYYRSDDCRPKYWKRGKFIEGFRISSPCEIDFVNYTIKTDFGVISFYRGHNRKVEVSPVEYTVSYNLFTKRYYISVLYSEEQKHVDSTGKKSVGIDLGMREHIAILSDGRVFENQKYLARSKSKLDALYTQADNKFDQTKPVMGQSKNWFKVKRRIARLEEHVYNQRLDYLHKVANEIARMYSPVCTETINTGAFIHNYRYMNALVEDAGWNAFMRMLSYKCDEHIKVDWLFPSSQLCSECGYRNLDIRDVMIRDWTCPECGAHHDRDLNAAKNIRRKGLFLCGERKARAFSARKQKSCDSQ